MSQSTREPEVIVRRAGLLGHIILNRPKALNALTRAMVLAIMATLREWATDDAVQTIAISGAGERGLCAGGDVVSMYHDAGGVTGSGSDAGSGGLGTEQFFADEYTLNAMIAHYPKPYVALMDGVVLGGGVGVSAHGSVRVVTERTRIGMPEVTIGFTPDVGGSWLLSHTPGELGTHLALTGGTATGADALHLGLADHFVPSGMLPALLTALETDPAATVLPRFAVEAPDSDLAREREWIDRCYAGRDASAIVERLAESEVGRPAASTIVSRSPTSVVVTLEALRRAELLASVEEALDQEYRVSLRMLSASDMREGIRAQVIDKDRQPHWSPATLAEVGDVEHFFAPLGDRELGLARTET